MRPTKTDLDNAISQPWSGKTCLLAQCMMRHGEDTGDHESWDRLIDFHELMNRFDRAFGRVHRVDWSALRQLRDELPETDDIITETKQPVCPNLLPNCPKVGVESFVKLA